MPEEYLDNPAILPPDEALETCETAEYLAEGITQFYNEAMTRIRAA